MLLEFLKEEEDLEVQEAVERVLAKERLEGEI
jgi:hypothetical protein